MTMIITPLLIRWFIHDLASPVATVMTASELLSDQPDPEINGLVQFGARRLGARMRMVRAALVPGDAPIGGSALEEMIRDGQPSTPIDWRRNDSEADGRIANVIVGAVLLMADVRRNAPLIIGNDGVHWDDGFAWPESITGVLAGADPVDTKGALAATLAGSAKRAGLTLAISPVGIDW
jgi:hypothetical protein